MSDDPTFLCRSCGAVNNLSDLTEVEGEKPDHSHFECSEEGCNGKKFRKLSEEADND